MRVGNDEYARQNESYGLTTLQDKHVKVEASRIRFRSAARADGSRISSWTTRALPEFREARQPPGNVQENTTSTQPFSRLTPTGSLFDALKQCSGPRREEACLMRVLTGYLEKVARQRRKSPRMAAGTALNRSAAGPLN